MRPITDSELASFQRFIFEQAGITMSAQKKALITGRLTKRLTAYQLEDFGTYFKMLTSGEHPDEVQIAVDLLTTNETYFFREIKHFDFLRAKAASSISATDRSGPYRVWSAASSTGEEAYSIAMVLSDVLGGRPWEVLGTDISSQVLRVAVRGLYPLQRTRHIPPDYLHRFCLKGSGDHEGELLIERGLRERLLFRQVNLNEALPTVGQFDIIFLRNVMIYFNDATKRDVVERLAKALKPDGFLCIGHSESLNKITEVVEPVAPSIYCKAR